MAFGAGRRGCLRPSTPRLRGKPGAYSDGKTLYFASNGHPGMGLDLLFPAVNRMVPGRKRKTSISHQLNGDENSLQVFPDGRTALFATDRRCPGTSTCGNLSCRDTPRRNQLHCGVVKSGMRIQRVPFRRRFRC